MRICILCEDSKVEKARSRIKNDSVLSISLSQSGLMPPTHWFCTMVVDKDKADKITSISKYSIVEISEPKDFLEKWNLKIII